MPKSAKPNLLTDLTAEPPAPNRRDVCRFAELIEARPRAEREAIVTAVDNPRWSSRSLAGVLVKHGVTVSSGAIQNHRNGTCPCFRNRTEDQ